ncbi:MAG: MBL fold metallo-hydrolase [Acidobacteria bacterium]|nr:MBL fold metallo-hydrolase [Acidobacteriota bacterium]
MKLTFLGTGTSVGVPMIGCECATCTSTDSRDKRLRTGLLIEQAGQRLVIDVSTDFRQQALRAGLTKLDALLITHCHADHVFGLDDIRPFNFKHGPIPVFASERTWRDLRRVFYYIFEAKHVGGGLPQVTPETITNFEPFFVGDLEITPIPVIHGKGEVTAFRLSNGRASVAFVTDCNQIAPTSLEALKGLDVLILDALRIKPHPTHLHLEQSLAYIEELKPQRTLLTHMGHDIKHSEISRHLPANIELAYDELILEL